MNFLQRFWRFITSIELGLTLLGLIFVMLIAGSVVEAREGLETAISKVYRGPFFDALIAIFGLNLTAVTLKRAPYRIHQAPWLLTHLAILIILAGAIYGRNGEEEGTLFLPEGEATSTYWVMKEDQEPRPMPLDFALTLDKFEIEMYPGSGKVKEYRSRVRLSDEARGKEFAQLVRVNHPIRYRGYVIAQQSYQLGAPVLGEPDVSVMSILRNPGMGVLFFGFVLLATGLIGVIFLKPVLIRAFPPKPRAPKPARPEPLSEHKESSAAANGSAAVNKKSPASSPVNA